MERLDGEAGAGRHLKSGYTVIDLRKHSEVPIRLGFVGRPKMRWLPEPPCGTRVIPAWGQLPSSDTWRAASRRNGREQVKRPPPSTKRDIEVRKKFRPQVTSGLSGSPTRHTYL